MKVLVACEESQRVCMAFRERGHEAYSCDIVDCSGGHPEWHIMCDVIPLLNGDCAFNTMDGENHYISGRWDMIIAFPPCTYLSNAGACRLYPKEGQLDMERYKKGLQAKEFFLKFLNADCDRIAVENPVSSSVFEMPKHTQKIQPYQFNADGTHPFTKKQGFGLKDCRCLFQQRRIASLLARMYQPVQEERTAKNTEPQKEERTQRTEQRHFMVSPRRWRNNGGKEA